MDKKIAIIVGAGPAGLTAAYELLKKTNIKPIIFEKNGDFGGISKTVNYKGNRIDIGGHRFFSKSEYVINFWLDILPIQTSPSKDEIALGVSHFGSYDSVNSNGGNSIDPEKEDKVMLVRKRVSRILFLRKFFDYPISLSINTILNLGLARIIKIGSSYFYRSVIPIKKEKNLEDFFINRFGYELYNTFFKDYTKKVWGVPCDSIKPEWGAQRVKGLSVSKALVNALKKYFTKVSFQEQKKMETSLIEYFIYPKFGPGQIWEEVAKQVTALGGEIYLNHSVSKIHCQDNVVSGVDVLDESNMNLKTQKANYLFSTMPVKELIKSLSVKLPEDVADVADGLIYRDFITVGLLLQNIKLKNQTKIKTINNIVPDNWIYIQEKEVMMGRIQIFNNWSPYMVSDPDLIWVGLEYFCNKNDNLWNMNDLEMKDFAVNELVKIGIIDKRDVLDGVVIRIPKAYPAYFGSYDKFHVIKEFTDRYENLFLIGRNGMHRYNNMDHSMLTAITAVENIIKQVKYKDNIWSINNDSDYHESN